MNQPTPRIQWILIRTFAYHFTVRYIPGVKISLQIVFMARWPKIPLTYLSSIYIRLPVKFMQEVIVYKIWQLQPKKMMSLPYLNTLLWLDSWTPSEKFQVRFNPIGPSEKSWQWNMALSWKAPILLFSKWNVKLCWTLFMKDIWVWTN